MKVKEDVEIGNTPKLQATPQIFFAGKKLPEGLKAIFMVDTLGNSSGERDPNLEGLETQKALVDPCNRETRRENRYRHPPNGWRVSENKRGWMLK